MNFTWNTETQEYSTGEVEEGDIDTTLVLDTFNPKSSEFTHCFTTYKWVDKKIKPVFTTFPEEAHIKHQMPSNPLKTITPLYKCPPEFTTPPHITQKHLNTLDINPDNFLSKKEKLFIQVMMNNEQSLEFVDTERGTLKKSYFSPYVMPTVPHTLWEYKNIPIPPGI